MNKNILLVIGAAILLTVGLFSLPKGVVRNNDRKLAEAGSGVKAAVPDSSVNLPDSAGMHIRPLAAQEQRRVDDARRQFMTVPAEQRPAAGQKLIDVYRSVSRYDSAAQVGEQLARLAPSAETLLRAGDLYYEAYGFAANAQKAAALGQKTRELYQKALDRNPNLLAAKANMAMTYVTTDTPMQGIMLLREILQQDPDNELALFNMGLLSMRSGQYNRAVERFRSILAANPANVKAQFYLAISLSELGKKDEARQLLAQVKEREKDPAIQQAIRELEKELQ